MALSKTAMVVGAGLSGLTAAYRLQQAGWHVKVLESTAQVGGRVQTIAKQGYLIDTGVSLLATSYDAYLALAQELKITDSVVDVPPQIGIPRRGKIHPLVTDQLIRSGLTTRLFSWSEKLRFLGMVGDLLRARKYLNYNDMRKSAPLDTESARDYSLRVLGQSLNDYFTDPLSRIMIIADGDKSSKVELFSAIINIFCARIQALQGGVNHFTATLASTLDVELQATVTRVDDKGDHIVVSWQSADGTEQSQQVAACVVTVPLPIARKLCPDYETTLGPLDDVVEYTSAITVALGSTVRPDTDAFVIPLPAVESRDLALLFLDHNKSPDRCPPGRYMINTHWETTASQQHLQDTDEQLVAQTINRVCQWFPEIRDSVEMTSVTRWTKALPMTSPGFYRAIDAFNQRVNLAARVQFAADYLSAAGQNTAVRFGDRSAHNLIQYFQ